MRLLPGLVFALFCGIPAVVGRPGDFNRNNAKIYLDDVAEILERHYYPPERLNKDFQARIKEAKRKLSQVKSAAEANVVVADTLLALDPNIRIVNPPSQQRVDPGWSWLMIGDRAYVTQVDTDSAARKQGLQAGDRLISINGTAVTRSNYQLLSYLNTAIAPQARTMIVVQSGDGPPRTLSLDVTLRQSRPVRKKLEGDEYILTDQENLRLREYHSTEANVRLVGDVAAWRAYALAQSEEQVDEILRTVGKSPHLIVDLRGLFTFHSGPAVRLLWYLLPDKTEVAQLKRPADKVPFKLGNPSAYRGTVLVLIDAQTGGYAEFIAWTLQKHRRAVIIGDHSLGRMVDEGLATIIQGPTSFTREGYWTAVTETGPNGQQTQSRRYVPPTREVIIEHRRYVWERPSMLGLYQPAGIRIPIGEIVAADGTNLRGKNVAPDYLLHPKPDDIVGKRDIVLARALNMLKQSITPEEAWRLFRNDWDDDEIVLDRTHLY